MATLRGPGHRAGHARRVPRRGCREHSGEPLTEHERLVLEHRVEQPQGGQRQLQATPPAGRFPRRCVARARRPRASHPPACSARCSGGGCWEGCVARARRPRASHPPACSARCSGGGCWGGCVARARRPRAIHPPLAANSQSQWGLLGSPNAPGVLRCAINWTVAMIRQRRWRAAAAQQRAGSGPGTADSAWPERYPRRIRGSPAIPSRRIMDAPKAYFIPMVHCGGTRVWNVIADPGQCVMQNNTVRRRSPPQRRGRDLGRGA